MNEPTHLDLFSGIGGFSLAAESVGFRTIGFSEIDPYACAVLKSKWPEIENLGAVELIHGTTDIKITLITGGFPCQPFSIAGKKRGDSDERFLWPELARIVSEIRPIVAFFENVPGLLTIDSGSTFNRIMSDLVAFGYDCLWNCVPASAIGADHQRDRLWIIAYANGSNGGIQSESRKECENPSIIRNNGSKGINSNTISERRKGQISEGKLGERKERLPSELGGWQSEPCLRGRNHGISNRSHRIRCLGNSIVPQVAQIFLKEIYKQLTPPPQQ